MTIDEKIHDLARAMIRRSSMEVSNWRFTSIGELRSGMVSKFALEPGELVLVSAMLDDANWYAMTTRRVVSLFEGKVCALDPRQGIEASFGNFKGYPHGDNRQLGVRSRERATLRTSAALLHFEYETGYASMAPIIAVQYWNQKHRILHKLLTTAEHEAFKLSRDASGCSKRKNQCVHILAGPAIRESWLEERLQTTDLDVLRQRELMRLGLDDETRLKLLKAGPSAEWREKWREFIARLTAGDELWSYRSPPATWKDFSGSAGYAIVRADQIIASLASMKS